MAPAEAMIAIKSDIAAVCHQWGNGVAHQSRVPSTALEPALREVVVLRYYLDMSGAEIAAVTDSPTGTVYWRLHQARDALVSLFAEDETLSEEMTARRK